MGPYSKVYDVSDKTLYAYVITRGNDYGPLENIDTIKEKRAMKSVVFFVFFLKRETNFFNIVLSEHFLLRRLRFYMVTKDMESSK